MRAADSFHEGAGHDAGDEKDASGGGSRAAFRPLDLDTQTFEETKGSNHRRSDLFQRLKKFIEMNFWVVFFIERWNFYLEILLYY